MENFHFAYTAILSKGTNRVEKHYSTFAINLRKSDNKQNSNKIITDLKKNLESLYPTYIDFKNKFITLAFSKVDTPLNLKTKYAINKLNCYYNNSEMFDDEGSIEHIIPEAGDKTLNIGNLILLENNLNVEAGDEEYASKKLIYGKSSYKWVKKFVDDNNDWNENAVDNRAETLAEIYYEKIFGRIIK